MNPAPPTTIQGKSHVSVTSSNSANAVILPIGSLRDLRQGGTLFPTPEFEDLFIFRAGSHLRL